MLKIVEVHINGLYPKSKCRIYCGTELVFEGNADNDGYLNIKLKLKKFKNRQFRLTSHLPGVIESLSEDIESGYLGIFHVANPVLETSYINDQGDYRSPQNLLNPSASAKQMASIYRTARYRNPGAQVAQWIIVLGSPFTGFFLVGWVGVVIGLIVGLISYYLGPYADGIKKAI